MGLSLSHPVEAKLLLLGLDSAGKTTILFQLKLKEYVSAISSTLPLPLPVTVHVEGATFNVWDLGGHKDVRPLWRHYYHGSEGLVFVVDSSDVSRVQEAREELFGVMKDDDMDAEVPLVVLANKQDLPNALKSSELVEKLGLRELGTNPWYVQEMCAITGDGLYEGITKLAELVKAYQKTRKVRR